MTIHVFLQDPFDPSISLEWHKDGQRVPADAAGVLVRQGDADADGRSIAHALTIRSVATEDNGVYSVTALMAGARTEMRECRLEVQGETLL